MNTPTPRARRQLLLNRRNEKMARSPHAYVRGNTARYYEWLHDQPGPTLPEGPPVWICGDCHVGNLGPLSDNHGKVELAIRDFDQTTIGNPVEDLVRLALSLTTVARNSSLPGIVTAQMLENLLDGYARAFRPGRARWAVEMPEAIGDMVAQAMKRSWKHLARERIEDTHPTIPLGKNFWPLSAAERAAIGQLCASDELAGLVTLLKGRDNGAAVALQDAAYWVKGCSSLGLLRYALLLKAGDDYCLLDIKEAIRTVSPTAAGAEMPKDYGRRVREGARALAPALGERMLAQRFMGRAVVIRELMPQDLKLEMEQLSLSEATCTARYLAYVVGLSHARQMDAATRRGWLRDLTASTRKSRAAPPWLWHNVVRMLVSHEAGYLQHCRRYAEVLGRN